MTLGKAQTGTRSSTPKITKLSGDDNLKVIYKNMGNNHTVPVIWADTVSMSGTEVTVASGIGWHGMTVASNANVTVTPLGDTGAVRVWIDKDTVNNVVKIKSSSTISNVDFDVKFMMGAASSSRYIEAIYCRGNSGASQSLP